MSNESQMGRGKEREADKKRGKERRKCVKIKCGRRKGQEKGTARGFDNRPGGDCASMSKQFLGKEVHPRQATSTIFAACTSRILKKVIFLEIYLYWASVAVFSAGRNKKDDDDET
jgi:hypothetical protein